VHAQGPTSTCIGRLSSDFDAQSCTSVPYRVGSRNSCYSKSCPFTPVSTFQKREGGACPRTSLDCSHGPLSDRSTKRRGRPKALGDSELCTLEGSTSPLEYKATHGAQWQLPEKCNSTRVRIGYSTLALARQVRISPLHGTRGKGAWQWEGQAHTQRTHQPRSFLFPLL
jgi:hypothetical protein